MMRKNASANGKKLSPKIRGITIIIRKGNKVKVRGKDKAVTEVVITICHPEETLALATNAHQQETKITAKYRNARLKNR